MIRELLFWGSAASVVFTYIGAPGLIVARAALRPRPARSAAIEPDVSIVIAARNEAASIGERLANLTALDYPKDRLQVIVASDGSDDATVELARAAASGRTEVLDLGRVGKADALNEAVARATGEIVVFTDANSSFAPDAVRRLVATFADPDVGGVAGNQVYTPGGATAAEAGERPYWSFDRIIKRAESVAGSTVSATGAIYALRRSLVPTIMAGVTDDFYTSTSVVDQGRRLVFAEDAIAYEPPAPSAGSEYRRKVRIITRGFRGVAARRRLLDPRRTGFYAVQLGWHKLLRRLMAVPLIVMALTSISLAGRSRFFLLLAAAQIAGYGTAAAGLLAPGSRLGRLKPVALGSFFVMVNLAALRAAVDVLRGKRIERWEPARAADPVPARASAQGGAAMPMPPADAAPHGGPDEAVA